LEQIESLAAPDFSDDDSVWAVTYGGFQQISNRYRW